MGWAPPNGRILAGHSVPAFLKPRPLLLFEGAGLSPKLQRWVSHAGQVVAAAPAPSSREWVIYVRPIETIDVSRPPASTGTAKAAAAVGDLALAVLLALILPLGLVLLFSPLAGLVRVALSVAGLL